MTPAPAGHPDAPAAHRSLARRLLFGLAARKPLARPDDRPAPAPGTRASAAVRFLVYVPILCASWGNNLLGIPDGMFWARSEPRTGYLGSESHLVVCRLAHPELPRLHPLAIPMADGGVAPYSSQFGLTGVGLAAVVAATGAAPATVARTAAAVFTGLTAAVLAAVFASAGRRLGPAAGDVACALAASTPVLLPFAPSLYWVPWLMLAPFALVWCLGPWAVTAGRRVALCGAVGLAVAARALCGYEYITAVALAPAAAAWFHLAARGESVCRRVLAAAVLTGCGGLGFAAAIGAHAAQQQAVFGRNGFEVIRDRAVARTTADPGGEAGPGTPAAAGRSRWTAAADCFLDYFGQRAVSVAGGFGRVRADVPLAAVVGLAAVGAGVAVAARRRLPPAAPALGGAVLIGLAASLSWQVLAVNHMCVHRHLNLIVFCVPFLPLAYTAAGYGVSLVAGPAAGGRVGGGLLAGVAVVMVVNLATDAHQRATAEADQRAAEAAVAARLGGPIPASAGGLAGAVDSARRADLVPPALATEYGWLDLSTGTTADPGGLVVTGWALGYPRRPARVVAAYGGAVIPSAPQRFRRPDIEALMGRSVPEAGFVARLPAGAVPARGTIRLFAVDTGSPARVVELAVRSE